MSLLFSSCGSTSADFPTDTEVENPLPPCPDSPNCVRITDSYHGSIDAAWQAVLTALQEMKPYDVEIRADEYRVDTIFLVVFFRDDMAVQLEASGTQAEGRERDLEPPGETTYVHIRSSSRLGHYDFGVNRRRVKVFLEKMSPG